MTKAERMRIYLAEEYGIHTNEQLERALLEEVPEIGVFTTPMWQADAVEYIKRAEAEHAHRHEA